MEKVGSTSRKLLEKNSIIESLQGFSEFKIYFGSVHEMICAVNSRKQSMVRIYAATLGREVPRLSYVAFICSEKFEKIMIA